MRSMGTNIIRLNVPWVGVESEFGIYNETYLNELEKVVNMAGDYGIYTLLDMH